MATITRDMGIMAVVEEWPETIQTFMNFGMGCIGCGAASYESIEQGATAHGIDVDALMEALNNLVEI